MSTYDLGGNDVVCKSLRVGANHPGDVGTEIVPSDLQFAGDTSVDGDLTVNGPTGTGSDCAGLLAFTTDETTIVDNDQIGRITFTAPDEASGTDAVTEAAFIAAEANATFDATTNSTDLVIGLGTSGAAAEVARFGNTGNLTLTGLLNATTVVGAVQNLSGAGAVNLTSLVTYVTTTANPDALTLADGTAGQIKIIVMVADGGAGVLTPSNYGNGTTLTFDDVGDSAMLVFQTGNWWNVGTPTATVGA